MSDTPPQSNSDEDNKMGKKDSDPLSDLPPIPEEAKKKKRRQILRMKRLKSWSWFRSWKMNLRRIKIHRTNSPSSEATAMNTDRSRSRTCCAGFAPAAPTPEPWCAPARIRNGSRLGKSPCWRHSWKGPNCPPANPVKSPPSPYSRLAVDCSQWPGPFSWPGLESVFDSFRMLLYPPRPIHTDLGRLDHHPGRLSLGQKC